MKLLVSLGLIMLSGLLCHINGKDIPDSLLTEKRIKALIVEKPDSVLRLADLAEQRKIQSLPPYKLDLIRALAYNELHMNSLKEMYAARALQSESINDNPTAKLNLLVCLAEAQHSNGKYQQSIETALSAISYAREIGNKPGVLSILGLMSRISFDMGDKIQGYNYLDQIVETSAESDNIRELANVSWAIGQKIIELSNDKNFQTAITESKLRLKIIHRIEELGGAPHGYTDQQYAYTYARLAAMYQNTGKPAEAQQAYNHYHKTSFSKTMSGQLSICDYLMKAARYREILNLMKPYYTVFTQGDTINTNYIDLLTLNAYAYRGLGDSKTGFHFLERANIIRDSLEQRENENKMIQFATIFKINEKELQLKKSQVESQKRQIMFLTTAWIGLIILLILFIVLYYYQLLWKKYKKMAVEIDHLLSQREYLREQASIQDTVEPLDETGDQTKLLLRIEKMILTEKLFLRGSNSKKEIAEKCGLSQSELTRLILVDVNLSFPEYLNKLKIDYSITMMTKHPEWTIEAIAQEAGFNNRGTYYQNFNKFYGMTPLQYRKAH